jgi:hypothetical protein
LNVFCRFNSTEKTSVGPPLKKYIFAKNHKYIQFRARRLWKI